MNPSDVSTLAKALEEMADALCVKAPGKAGLGVWLRVLQHQPIGKVIDAVDEWIRTRPKMPTPADILGALSNRVSNRIEAHTPTRQAIADFERPAPGSIAHATYLASFRRISDCLPDLRRPSLALDSEAAREAQAERAAIAAQDEPL